MSSKRTRPVYRSGPSKALAQEQRTNSAFVVLNEQLQARVDLLEQIVGNAMNYTDGLHNPAYARDAGGIKFLKKTLIESYELLVTPKNR